MLISNTLAGPGRGLTLDMEGPELPSIAGLDDALMPVQPAVNLFPNVTIAISPGNLEFCHVRTDRCPAAASCICGFILLVRHVSGKSTRPREKWCTPRTRVCAGACRKAEAATLMMVGGWRPIGMPVPLISTRRSPTRFSPGKLLHAPSNEPDPRTTLLVAFARQATFFGGFQARRSGSFEPLQDYLKTPWLLIPWRATE